MLDPRKKLKDTFNIDIPPDVDKLTMDEVKEELKKLMDITGRTGFLYFLIAYVKVSHTTKGSVPLSDNLFQWQWDSAIDFLSYTQIVSLKSRQIGFSTIVGAYALYRNLFFQSQETAIVSLTQRDSVSFLSRVKFIYKNLPGWMRAETSELAKTTISFAKNNSTIVSLPNNDDPGRGATLSLLIADEFSSFQSPLAFLAAATPALSTGMMDPFTNSSIPSQFFIISTLPRNPIDNEYLRILHDAQENDDSEFHLIDASVEDIPHYNDPAWHKKQQSALGDRLYAIEILKQEVYDIETALLPSSVLQKMTELSPIRVDFLYPDDVDEEGYYRDMDKMPFIKEDYDPKYSYVKNLWIWEDPKEFSNYIVTVDTATGKSDDYSAIEVFNLNTLEQVAEYRGKVDLETFKHIIKDVTQYYSMAKLSIENTGLGQGIVDFFAETENYENLYWHKKSKKTLVAGFPMTATTRANSIATFASYMTRGDLKIHSIRAINEIRSFGYLPSGRIESIGGNDDLVFCLTQVCYLNNIGWAAADNITQNNLVFGQLIKDIDGPEEEKSKVVKYWEERFDMQLDQESKDFIDNQQDQVPMETMEALLKERQ